MRMHYFNFSGFDGDFPAVSCARNGLADLFQRSPRPGNGGLGKARSAVAARCKARPTSIHSEHSPQNVLPGGAARSQYGQNPGLSRSSRSSIMRLPTRRRWRPTLRTSSQGGAASQTMILQASLASLALRATRGSKKARWEFGRVVQG